MNESGNIIRNIFGESYKEAESITIDASESLTFSSPKEVTFHGERGGKIFRDYVNKYDFVPFAELQKSDDLKVVATSESTLVYSLTEDIYKVKSDLKIEFNAEALKKEKTILKFKLRKANKEANDPDGYLKYKLTAINGQEFVVNHKKEVEHDLGIKNYNDIIEITFSKNLMETVQFIDFYFKDNSNDWFDMKGDLPDQWEHCGRVTIGKEPICYCLNKGLVDRSCLGKGAKVSDEDYKKLANELDTEEAAIYAVSKRESSGKSFTIQNGKEISKILYERHYMFRLLSSKYGESFAKAKMETNPYLVNSTSGKYVYDSEGIKQQNEEIASHEKFNKARKIDEDIAIQSCSWGAFQVMGEYYNHDYESPQEFEKAMNMCEKQQLSYFKTFLLKVKTKAHKALKDKNWEKFTYWYNGANWKTNNETYPTDMEKYYKEYKSK
ncbi:N-acetylmuramidase domain-containing protein [Flavobacterium branchiicola]|uniref:N-acetylmuramidase domain-containing protein n=1 Tax=Flavobacterium branchiicola TaxID=1114875 RepID=A0ABV9PB82_9FLAO|nr:N-acetylmuramidase domain-containing protein [Flavobacterium branchiicola]MBS7253710.1 DUF3380 domain-containing protein [Flavobacterium branchiicola]